MAIEIFGVEIEKEDIGLMSLVTGFSYLSAYHVWKDSLNMPIYLAAAAFFMGLSIIILIDELIDEFLKSRRKRKEENQKPFTL